jgi:medium-chain acyl-[acyl-carrier-protein] hydrolase
MQFRQKVTLSAEHVDRFGRCKASTLLYFAQEAATGHCDLLKLDWDTMAAKKLFWAVIRTHVLVTKLPQLGQTVTLQTWPMPTTRTAYPRAVEILDEAGNVLVQILSLWVLMDLNSRAMVLPGKSGIDVPGLLTGTELAAPGSIVPRQQETKQTRTVTFSELDRNGHMNNTRYLDWVNDLLPSTFHEGHPIKEFTVCYLNEALEGQALELSYGMDENGIFQVDGCHWRTDDNSQKTRVFSVNAAF